MMKNPFRIEERLLFRTPALPLPSGPVGLQLQYVYDARFREALFLASPDFFRELDGQGGQFNRKLSTALYKYAARAMTRATPFGLFAGVGIVSWGEGHFLRGPVSRNTRLDMNYICSLGQQLAEKKYLKEKLRYFPNNSIQDCNGSIRYVEYRYKDTVRSSHMTAVEKNEYLLLVLEACRNGKTIPELCSVLCSEDVEEEEALGFIDELIDSRLLTSEIEPNVTGRFFYDRLLDVLEDVRDEEAAGVLRVLKEVKKQLEEADDRLLNDISVYENMKSALEGLPVKFDTRYLFQSDLFFPAAQGGPSRMYKKELLAVFHALVRLAPAQENSRLREFKERFTARYEDRELPLSEVLDEESGIGFGGHGGTYSPFVEGIAPPGNSGNGDLRWNELTRFLHRKLTATLANQSMEYRLTDEDLEKFPPGYDDLPDTIAVYFKIIDNVNGKLQVNACGGPTAAGLISRFAAGNSDVEALAKDITRYEQQLRQEDLLAEVVYLPENRTGNILHRPLLREYEIPYLTRSGVADDYTIPLSDLLVSVVNNRVVLRSRKLGKRIYPRLTTAHNHIQFGLPAYRFLCALQSDGLRNSLGFSWGALAENYRFLPRVVYRDVVLFPATWQLKKEDCSPLFSDEDWRLRAQKFRDALQLPEELAIAENDNLLYIRLDDETAVQLLTDTIGRRQEIKLEEFLGEKEKHVVRDENGNGFANEFVAFLLREKSAPRAGIPVPQQPAIPASFPPGSEWAYFKIYCGDKTADETLVHCIAPMIRSLQEKKITDQWFWIRYADPDPHLRLRLHTAGSEAAGKLPGLLREALEPMGNRIWKLQMDTYNRELERYGNDITPLAESLFCIDSACTLRLLENLEGDEGENYRWRFGLLSVMNWLRMLNPESGEQELLDRMKTGVFNQYGGTKELKLQLDAKFRELRGTTEQLFAGKETEEYEPLREWIAERSATAKPVLEEIGRLRKRAGSRFDYTYFCSSIIHMSMNRLNRSAQNLHELVTYDMLYRHLRSQKARSKGEDQQ
ncbi:MAG: lantibiotic dehydratase [Bacteroidetes bacterium]|nr:MAG: lantibiotic dehydratase [Bacteroidota bacterium]